MAVSKRLRYEILRRDNHACRYCGATAPDHKLTVDHVIPTTLGGSDEPSNLVAACVDCNAGKTSSNPDAPLVDDVKADALRWAWAMQLASTVIGQEREKAKRSHAAFIKRWDAWDYHYPVPNNFPESIDALVKAGLTDSDLVYCVDQTMQRRGVANRFRYFCGVAWSVARDKQELTAGIANGLAEAEAPNWNPPGPA